jgi:two-component system, LytTR family, sensor kinase
MNFGNRRYWIFQAGGWGFFVLSNLFFVFLYGDFHWKFGCNLLIFFVLGNFFSHLMRGFIHYQQILLKPIRSQILQLILLTFITASLFAISYVAIKDTFNLYIPEESKDKAFYTKVLSNTFTSFLLLFIWNCIYFIYHFIEKSRRQQLNTLQLEALIKELELKTIKAHINPHFIFNSLNSIRALIDENPVRARNAITELSNILRSSMAADKSETVSFEKELNIVKDYLALENMRFEDRLKVQYEIDEDTLDQPVPPMMLQTLVENAIKHGISKHISGGVIKIISDYRNHFHELAVQNTGQLNGYKDGDEGFGISSTQNRLGLLYGDKASFEIRQLTPSIVEAKVLIPVTPLSAKGELRTVT